MLSLSAARPGAPQLKVLVRSLADPNSQRSEHDKLVGKLASITDLTAGEIAAVRGLPMTIATLDAAQSVVREGDRPAHSCVLLDGMLFRYKFLPTGGRQIMSFHVPGDIPDLLSLHLRVMDHSLGAVTQSRVAYVPHAALRELISSHPGLCAALWRETLIDAAIFREWLTGVGRRTSYQRVAHLMCEMFVKFSSVGLAQADACPFPISQSELGDALGLSTVHVNRTLQELRRDGLIVLQGRTLVIPDWDVLKEAAQFDAAYLHLEKQTAP